MSTVTVSLKYPNGIILEVGAEKFPLNGYNSDSLCIIEGFDRVGLTHGVPEALWKAWLEKHKDHPLHLNGLIFASASENKARAESKERKGLKSGMEAMTEADFKAQGVEGDK